MPDPSTELKQLSRKHLYAGRIIDLYVDEVEYPSGRRSVREVAHHPGGAAVVPLTDDGKVILVDQLRYPLARHMLELPAGKLGPGEDPAHCAARELEEETGWLAGSLTKLCSFHTSPGFCDELLHVYLARDLRLSPHGHKREEGEFTMSLQMVPLEEALAMVDRGEITDAKTLIGLMLVAHRRTT
ncbi:MAG: ADP-ribose pyrophosphatase [Bacteroidetes bacterium]|nr:ADP-ribose pyrophosphatase [Bacteroidota bacterium]